MGSEDVVETAASKKRRSTIFLLGEEVEIEESLKNRVRRAEIGAASK